MKLRYVIGTLAAGLLVMTSVGTSLADDTVDTSDPIVLEITATNVFSVEITGSTNFRSKVFTLAGPANWTDSASYNLKVTDLRGTGAGWNVTAEASPFTPSIPGAGLISSNNVSGGYTVATAGSVTNGVTLTGGSPDIMSGPASLLYSTPGIVNARPNGTGVFTTQEAVYYVGMPAALAVASYSTTVTLTLSGTQP